MTEAVADRMPGSPTKNPPSLAAERLVVGYGAAPVLNGVDIEVLDGEFTVIVGPNACGKSTLLRSLARVLDVQGGEVLLDGKPITSFRPKGAAKRIGLLPQSPSTPDGIVVSDLVARGRFPHQSLVRQWSTEDERAVESALEAANVAQLADRSVTELSGGQRQRVWIAMALAQETPILLLDEPTAYLDLAHQLDVLDLASDLQKGGRTVVAVLHELNLAFRYATHLVVMRQGEIVAQGAPNDIVTAELIEKVFDLPCRIAPDPETGTPLVIPLARRRRA